MRHDLIDEWPTARDYVLAACPDDPVYFFAPSRLRARFATFASAFSGRVTYAVKANDSGDVLRVLAQSGMTAFDVASPVEMAQVRAVAPLAELHYHNPVRSRDEIAQAKRFGIRSWSIDAQNELDKLGVLTPSSEIAVRFKLPMQGAAYDFGEKFGATPDVATALVRAVAARGLVPTLTFHPGTQCRDADAWVRHIRAAGDIARDAGVTLTRLNVGGGFAANRGQGEDDLRQTCEKITAAARSVFGAACPDLVCEPGRSMVGDSFAVGLRVKSLRPDGSVILNDGIYGALAEWRDMGAVGTALVDVFGARGAVRSATVRPTVVFGPTCDSLDRVPDPMPLPVDLQEGDHLLIRGMGAYSQSLACRFNGFGAMHVIKTQEI